MIPIAAMTANALFKDIQVSFDAEMNCHLSKSTRIEEE